MTLTRMQCEIILEALREKYGRGYSSVPEVATLQARLSIELEMAREREK